MRPLTFRTQFTMNALTVLVVVLLMLSTNTFASPGFSVLGQTAPTTTISYQGRLTNRGGVAISTSVPMIFRLYAAPTGGTALWTETRNGGNVVPVTNGVFAVLLGSVTPISVDLLNRDLWLTIAVNGDPEMTPREKIGSVPYASRAGSVVDGSIGSTKLADASVTGAKLADGSVSPRDVQTTVFSNTVDTETSTSSSQLQTLDGMSVTIPAAQVPTQLKALLLFEARCRPNPNDPNITRQFPILFYGNLDDTPINFYDAYPEPGQMLMFGFHKIVTLTPGIDHTVSVKWRVDGVGTAQCYNRNISVILLGQ